MPMTAGEALSAALAARGGDGAHVAAATSQSWASATFAGARHRVTIRMPSEGADRFVAGLEEADFKLGRHLLADIAAIDRAVDGGDTIIRIEALTIEES